MSDASLVCCPAVLLSIVQDYQREIIVDGSSRHALLQLHVNDQLILATSRAQSL